MSVGKYFYKNSRSTMQKFWKTAASGNNSDTVNIETLLVSN